MAPVLASIEWPVLTYLWDCWESLNRTDMIDETVRLFWAILLIVSRTLLLSSTQTGEDCLSLGWGLVGRAHLTVLLDYRPGMSSFVGFLGVTCRLAVCATRLLWGTRSVCVQPIFWSLIVRIRKWLLTTFSVVKLSRRSRREAHSLDVNNSESNYRPHREHFPCRIVSSCWHFLSLYVLLCTRWPKNGTNFVRLNFTKY